MTSIARKKHVEDWQAGGLSIADLHLSYFKPDAESYLPNNTSNPTKFIESDFRPANTKVSNTFGSDYHHKSVSKHEGIDYSGREDNLLPGWQTLEWGKKEEEDL